MDFYRISSRAKVVLTGVVLIAVSVPLGGLSIAEFLRGVTGDLSVTTLLLLALPYVSFPIVGRGLARGEGLTFIAITAFAFYPFALGFGMFDPYRLGFGNVWFIALLLLIAVVAWLKQFTLIALSISLAVLAWSFGWYESNNLWDYLLDPWVSIYALVVLIQQGVRKFRTKTI